MKCDILVVGAGPAGSSAAKAAAERGAKTLLVDKKKRIGFPEQCGGAVASYLLSFLPFNLPRKFLNWEIDTLKFHADGITINRSGSSWTCYAIRRSELDAWLAEKAKDAGAELRINTELTNLQLEGERVVRATVKSHESEYEIEPKAVIAADGVSSTVIERLGIKNKDAIVGNATSYEFEKMQLDKPHSDQLFFSDFSDGGYAYIFPLSKDRANIGVGSITQKKLGRCFDEFCELPEVKKQIKSAIAVKEKSGSVPFSHLTDKIYYGNVLLAGDAASQTIKPLVEGFLPSVICGYIAGKTAAQNLGTGNFDSYQKNIDRRMGLIFRESDKYIDVLEEVGTKLKGRSKYLITMGLCSGIFMPEDVAELRNESSASLARRLEDWNASRIKQLKSNLADRVAILLLRLFSQ